HPNRDLIAPRTGRLSRYPQSDDRVIASRHAVDGARDGRGRGRCTRVVTGAHDVAAAAAFVEEATDRKRQVDLVEETAESFDELGEARDRDRFADPPLDGQADERRR